MHSNTRIQKVLLGVFALTLLPIPAIAQLSPSGVWAAKVAARYDVMANVVYRTQGNWLGKLDVYVPVDLKKANTTLLWIHGGGWTQSSKEQELLYIMPYLEMGWSVVNVEYRLVDTALAPAAVEDCRCALGWLVDNAEKFKFDTSKIVVSGISAGGHLALMSGLPTATAGQEAGCDKAAAAKVAAIINWFGPSDMNDLLEGPNEFDQAVTWFGGQPNRASLAKQVSPLTYVRRGLPPVITIHGDRDNLIPHAQSVRLHNALTKAGVPNRLVTLPNRGHGDFTDNEWLRSYAAIRNFLVKNKVLRRM